MRWVAGALKLFPLIVTAVNAIERFATTKKGSEKQDEAVAMVSDLVPLVEASIGRDVVNDTDVQQAIRKVIDAVVALQNVVRDVVARRAGAAGR